MFDRRTQKSRRQSPFLRHLLFATPFALALGLPAAAQLPPELGEQVDTCVETTMKQQGAPGAGVALVFAGELALERGYGVRRLESGEPVTPASLFRPGSVQKMMTSAAVLRQVESGTLEVADSVRTWIPELAFGSPLSVDAITVEDLLVHTSGIPDMSDPNCTQSLSEWAGSLGGVPLFAPAGAFFNYTNAGYSLAGLVAERAAGASYGDVMRAEVWGPAGMQATFETPAEAIAYGEVAWGHEIDPDTGELASFPPDTFECPWAHPSGDFFTTAGDLARFALTLIEGGGAMLDPDSVDALLTPRVDPIDVPGEGYGYGVFSQEIEGTDVYYHSGGVPGGASHLLWVPEHGFGVAVVANRAVPMSAAAECILDAALGIEWPEPDLEPDPDRWRRFGGFYVVQAFTGDLFPALVRLRNDELHLRTIDPTTGERRRVTGLQIGQDTFWFDLDGDGEPNGLEIVTFVEGTQGHTWMRNRLFVGTRLWGPLRVAASAAPLESLELGGQPGAGMGPVALDTAFRSALDLGDLLHSQPTEEP